MRELHKLAIEQLQQGSKSVLDTISAIEEAKLKKDKLGPPEEFEEEGEFKRIAPRKKRRASTWEATLNISHQWHELHLIVNPEYRAGDHREKKHVLELIQKIRERVEDLDSLPVYRTFSDDAKRFYYIAIDHLNYAWESVRQSNGVDIDLDTPWIKAMNLAYDVLCDFGDEARIWIETEKD